MPVPRSKERAAAVAVAESDEATRNSIRFALEAAGYAVLTFSDGASLLGSPPAMRADAFILDHHLPDMPGPDLLTALRAAGAAAPASFLAGRVTPALRRGAASLHAAILHKPLIGDALTAAVAELLAERAS